MFAQLNTVINTLTRVAELANTINSQLSGGNAPSPEFLLHASGCSASVASLVALSPFLVPERWSRTVPGLRQQVF
jgi:hypothetical protein